jgi:hypothetical protein
MPYFTEVFVTFFQGGTMCCISITYSSINITQHCEPDLLGILCLLGSCFCTTTATLDAKHQGDSVFSYFLFPLDYRIKHADFSFLSVQIVEPFTAHYVFALGVARFLSCAHWVLQVRLSKYAQVLYCILIYIIT